MCRASQKLDVTTWDLTVRLPRVSLWMKLGRQGPGRQEELAKAGFTSSHGKHFPPEFWVSQSSSSAQLLVLLTFAPHSLSPTDPNSPEETPPLPCDFLVPVGLRVCKANPRALPVSPLLTALAIFFNASYPLLI